MNNLKLLCCSSIIEAIRVYKGERI
jgi:hypothetical protein